MFKISSSNMITATGGKIEQFFAGLTFAIPLLMGIYLFFNPFPHTTAIKEFCFYLSVLVLIVLLIFKKTDFSLRSPLTLSFVLFFLWGIFGLFFTLDFNNSLHDLRAHLLNYYIIFYLLINYFNSRKKLEILSWIVISSATFFSIGAIIYFYFILGNPFSVRLGVTFLEIHTDYIGFVTIFAISLALNKLYKSKTMAYKLLVLTCFFITLIATLLSQSRGASMGLFAALVILCFSNKKNIVFVIIMISLMFFTPVKERLDHKEFFRDTRTKINRLGIMIIKEYPIAGIGFGMQIYGNKNLLDLEKFNSKLPPEYRQQGVIVDSPHNTIIDVTVRTGIIGLVLFLNIILTAIWMLWKILKLAKSEYFRSWIICLFACFMSFLIPAMFADTTFGQRAVVFYTILAMITILWNINEQSKSDNNVAELKEHPFKVK